MRFMVSRFFTVLVSVVLVGSGYAQTSFVRIDGIHAAAPREMEWYYDVQTGDVLVSLGEGVLLFGFVGETLEALDRSQLSTNTGLVAPFDLPNELFWYDLPDFTGFSLGIYNLGPMLPVYPNGEIEVLEINELTSFEDAKREFDVNAYFSYSAFDPGFTLAYGVAGNAPIFAELNIVRPTFPFAAIPEPYSAIMFLVAGAGLLVRRCRA